MTDLNKIPDFLGQIPTQIGQINVGSLCGHVVTYSKDHPVLLIFSAAVTALALAILYLAYQHYNKPTNSLSLLPTVTPKNDEVETKPTKSIKHDNINHRREHISLNAQNTFDQLFDGSRYSIDNLPIYQRVLSHQHRSALRTMMRKPVEMGIMNDNRRFFVIKLDCDLTDENLEKMDESTQNMYKEARHIEDVLILYPEKLDDWEQLDRNQTTKFGHLVEYIKQLNSNPGPKITGDERIQLIEAKQLQLKFNYPTPSFFTGKFTDNEGAGPLESQKENFEKVKLLLKTGQSLDTNGLLWRIPAK